jgi:hypothetical protein
MPRATGLFGPKESAAVVLLVVSVGCVYLTARFLGWNVAGELGRYVGTLMAAVVLALLVVKAARQPIDPTRLIIASLLIAGVIYGLSAYRDWQQALP